LLVGGTIGKYRVGIRGFTLIAVATIIVLIIVQQWVVYIGVAILPLATLACVGQI
jgi:hypothetical protein